MRLKTLIVISALKLQLGSMKYDSKVIKIIKALKENDWIEVGLNVFPTNAK